MYCTQSDILNLIPERQLVRLTVDNPTASSTINSAVLEGVFNYTEDLINGYLRTKYTLPLTFLPDLIKNTAVDIAAYRLYLRRPSEIPEHLKDNFKIAIETLTKIQKGTIILDLPAEHPHEKVTPVKCGFRSNKNPEDKIFSDNLIKQFGGDLL